MKESSKKRYPSNWEFISAYIRHERAKNRCEQCGLQKGEIIKRLHRGKYHKLTFNELEQVQLFMEQYKINEKTALKKLGLTKIFLIVAHLDWNESNNDYNNLKAMCQRCSLVYDKQNNVQRIKSKRKAHGQGELDF